MKFFPLLVQYLPLNSDHFVPLPTVFPDGISPNSSLAVTAFTMNYRLFPERNEYEYTYAWSTSVHVALPFVQYVQLDDRALGVHGVDRRTTHSVVSAPVPSHEFSSGVTATNLRELDHGQTAPRGHKRNLAWEAYYPKGSINPSGSIAGGFGFYLSGPSFFRDALVKADATEAVFAYSVMFERNWEWVLGGKLPGAFGGEGDAAYRCTGGRMVDRDVCFDLRLMWRSKGAGELYTYLPLLDANTEALLAVPPKSIQHPDYGFSVGRGSFSLSAGTWHTVYERVRLNDVGKANGEIELRLNGEKVMLVEGLTIRTSEAARIKGLHFQTFFGGSSAEWASPYDQHAWFADVSGAIIQRTQRQLPEQEGAGDTQSDAP